MTPEDARLNIEKGAKKFDEWYQTNSNTILSTIVRLMEERGI